MSDELVGAVTTVPEQGVEEPILQGDATVDVPASPSEEAATETTDGTEGESKGLANQRAHIKSLESQLADSTPYRNAIEEIGGLEMIPVVSKFMSALAADDFNPHNMAVIFNEITPERFNQFAGYIARNVESKAESVVLNKLFGTDKVDSTDIQGYRKWAASGKPATQNDFELSEDDLVDSMGNPLPPKQRELLLQAKRELAEFRQYKEKEANERQASAEVLHTQAVEAAVTAYAEQRIANVLDKACDDLGLTTPTGNAEQDAENRIIAMLLKVGTMFEFSNDEKDMQEYNGAKKLITENPNLDTNQFVKNKRAKIELAMSEKAKPIINVLKKIRTSPVTNQINQINNQQNKQEVGSKATAAPALPGTARKTPLDTSQESIMEDIARLRAAGRIR